MHTSIHPSIHPYIQTDIHTYIHGSLPQNPPFQNLSPNCKGLRKTQRTQNCTLRRAVRNSMLTLSYVFVVSPSCHKFYVDTFRCVCRFTELSEILCWHFLMWLVQRRAVRKSMLTVMFCAMLHLNSNCGSARHFGSVTEQSRECLTVGSQPWRTGSLPGPLTPNLKATQIPRGRAVSGRGARPSRSIPEGLEEKPKSCAEPWSTSARTMVIYRMRRSWKRVGKIAHHSLKKLSWEGMQCWSEQSSSKKGLSNWGGQLILYWHYIYT